MDEDLTAVVAGEKAIPLVGVIPLDLAGRHAQTSRRKRELKNSQRSGDRQDAMGDSKAIGPGGRTAASLSPVSPVLPGSRNSTASSAAFVPVRPHTFGWCWDGIACEAGVRVRSSPMPKTATALYPALISRNMRHRRHLRREP